MAGCELWVGEAPLQRKGLLIDDSKDMQAATSSEWTFILMSLGEDSAEAETCEENPGLEKRRERTVLRR